MNLSPKEALDWKNEGDHHLFYKKNYQKALECYNKAIKLEPENALFWYCKGKVYYYMGNEREKKKFHKKATEFLDKALKLNPREISTLIALVLNHAALKNYNKVINYFKLAEAIDPKHPKVKEYRKSIKKIEKARDKVLKQIT